MSCKKLCYFTETDTFSQHVENPDRNSHRNAFTLRKTLGAIAKMMDGVQFNCENDGRATRPHHRLPRKASTALRTHFLREICRLDIHDVMASDVTATSLKMLAWRE